VQVLDRRKTALGQIETKKSCLAVALAGEHCCSATALAVGRCYSAAANAEEALHLLAAAFSPTGF
jgi:hypothetical protein